DRNPRPGVHHQNVGAKLLETPNQIFAIAMLIDEGEQIEIALGIANHSFKLVDLKETEIAVVILNAFLLEFVALLGSEPVLLAALGGAQCATLMIHQVGLAIVGALPIWTAFELHLEQAQVNPELQFFPAIQTLHFTDLDRAGFVRPTLEKTVQVETHRRKQSSSRLLCQRIED